MLAVVSSFAFAAKEGSLYAGVGVGQSDAEDICVSGLSCDENDTAWSVFGGWQASTNFAVELGYADLGDFETGPFNISAHGWGLTGLAILPVNDMFSVYGRAGVAHMETNTNYSSGDTSDDTVWGVGANMNVNDQIGIRADWQLYTDVGGSNTGTSNVDVYSLSATYSF